MARVLLVGKGPPERGGIPAFLLLLWDGLGDRHRVTLLNLTRADEPPEGGRLSRGNARRTLQDAVAVWREAGGHDLVHVHSALAPLVTLVRAGILAGVARLRGATVLVHAHGGRVQLWGTRPWRRRLVRLLLAPARRVVAVSPGGREALAAALGPDRVALVPNGVDTDRFRPDGEGATPPRVLYVGILTPRKGVVDLLEASRRLTDRELDHELWLAGGTPDEGPDAEEEVRVAAAGTPARLLGSRPHEEMPELYRSADVFCLPSWWEALPLSLLEAMASGLAVVATDVGAVREVLDGAGVVVPPRDPAALAEALGDLLADPERRRALGGRARERVVGQWSSAAVLDAVDALYRAAAP